MSKILDSNTLTGYTSKIIELRKGYIINGQYYLKDNMQPVPFNTVNLDNSYFCNNGNGMMHLDRSVKKLDYIPNTLDQVDSLIAYDTQDERYTYIVTRSGYYELLAKFKEENNRCELEKYIILNTSAYITVLRIEDEEDNISIINGGGGVATTKISYMKSDLSCVNTKKLTTSSEHSSYPYDAVSIVDENLYFKAGYGFIEFSYYVEEINKPVVQSLTDPSYGSSSSNRHKIFINNVLSKDEDSIKVLYPVSNSIGTKTYLKQVELCTFDLKSSTWSKKTIEIDHGDFDKNYYNTGGTGWATDQWIKKIGGKTYMFLYLRSLYSFSESRMLVFEVNISGDTDYSVKLVKKQDFPIGQNGKIISFKDDTKLKFYGSCKATAAYDAFFSSVYCYELDESKLEFVKTFDVNGSIKEFGFDKDRNLYILWSDLSVSRHNDRTVANFNARFENGLYEYEGEDISTNLIISTTNLQGDHLSKEVKLDIKGNAKFTSNGLKTITVSTSDSQETSIPVTITGAGALNIFPKIKA